MTAPKRSRRDPRATLDHPDDDTMLEGSFTTLRACQVTLQRLPQSVIDKYKAKSDSSAGRGRAAKIKGMYKIRQLAQSNQIGDGDGKKKEKDGEKCTYLSCNFIYNSSAMLSKHVKDSHRRGLEGQVCQVCNERSFCEICQEILKSPNALKLHLKGHGVDPEHPCTICGRIFTSKLSLDDHRSREHGLGHDGVKSYPCEFCWEFFKDRLTLTIHRQKMHLDAIEAEDDPDWGGGVKKGLSRWIKPYKCAKC